MQIQFILFLGNPLLFIKYNAQSPGYVIRIKITEINNHSEASLLYGAGIEKLISVERCQKHWNTTMNRLRGAQKSSMGYKSLDLRMAQ